MEALDEYLCPGWESRVKTKLLGTVAVAAGAAALMARRTHMPVSTFMPQMVWGYATGIMTFCVVQEGVRSLRGGKHDVWNSGIAGAVAGGITMRRFKGPKHSRVGAVTWAALAVTGHGLNSLLQPRLILEDVLVYGGLLSEGVVERRGRQQALEVEQRRTVNEVYGSIRLRHQQRHQDQATSNNSDASGTNTRDQVSAALPGQRQEDEEEWTEEMLMAEAHRIRQREMQELARSQGYQLRFRHPHKDLSTPQHDAAGPHPAHSTSKKEQSPGDGQHVDRRRSTGGTRDHHHHHHHETAVHHDGQTARQSSWWWWGWWGRKPQHAGHSTGRLDPSARPDQNHTGHAAYSQSRSEDTLGGSSRQRRPQQKSGGTYDDDNDDDDDDDGDYERWLASRGVGADGLVVPESIPVDLKSLQRSPSSDDTSTGSDKPASQQPTSKWRLW